MSDFPGGRWRARWIWCEQPKIELRGFTPVHVSSDENQRFACFRRVFDVDAVPTRVPARVTADSRYILWVNGVEVARGPVRSNTRRLHCDGLDLAPHLRPGRNLIAVLARYYGYPTPWWAPVPPALQLGAGALVFEAQLGADAWLVSDGTWRSHASTAWEPQRPRGVGGMSPECHDARELPADWCALDFDDSGWSAAVELSAYSLGWSGRHEPPSHPYGALPERPIPFLSGQTVAARVSAVTVGTRDAADGDPVARARADLAAATPLAHAADGSTPVELASGADTVAVAVFDFGRVVCGTAVLDVEAPAGARFDVAAAELRRADGAIDFDDQHTGFSYVARGAHDRFESFDPIGMRYAVLSVRADAPVRVRELSVQERLYPRAGGPFFACSDPRLEQIWAVGRRTVDLCSHDAYLDCPTREQRAWTGDFVVHQMVDLTTNPDWRLARWHVELAASPRPDGMLPMAAAGDIEGADSAFIPDWALHWIRALHNLYRYTGDRALIARLLPVAENVLRWFEPFQGLDGLLTDVTGWVIIDWSSVSVAGRSSVLNALWARALRDLAEMSAWLGDASRAAWARAKRAELAAAFNVFWDPQRRLYVDHLAAGVQQRPVSQHAQAAPLAAGLVPAERVARVVEVLTDERALVHATWSRAHGDARRPGPGESGVGGPYLVLGPPAPWWDVETQIVRAQPFFRYVVHDGLCEAGRADLIPSLCLDWMALLERCATSWSETWYGGTTSHGWSSTPTRDLSMRTLGVTPAEPGFALARIAPRLGPLAWARGAVPTPAGLLHVDVNAERIEVDSPVPVELDLGGGAAERYRAGRHVVASESRS